MDNSNIKTCYECGSQFLKSSSNMMGLCPECSFELYGYENCEHIFKNGRCNKCYWDGSRSNMAWWRANKCIPDEN